MLQLTTANFANAEKFEPSVLKAESAFSRIQDLREFNGVRVHTFFIFRLKLLHRVSPIVTFQM